MASYERSVTESPDRESASRADEYTRNFLQGEALPTIWQELAFHRRFLPGDHAGRNQRARPRLVPRAEPPRHRVRAGSGRRHAARSRRSSPPPSRPRRRSASSAYVDAGAGQALMEAPPARGHDREDDAARRGRHHRVDAVERRHGRAQADDAEGGSDPVPRHRARRARRWRATRTSLPARAADDVVPAGGVGQFNAATLDKMLAGQGGRRPAVHRRDRAGDGGRQHAAGSRDDVPAAVPAVHAAARRSDGVRRDGVAGARACWRTRSASPDVVFNQTLDAALSREQPAAAARDAGHGGASGTWRSRWRSTRRASPTRATSRSSSSAASRPR